MVVTTLGTELRDLVYMSYSPSRVCTFSGRVLVSAGIRAAVAAPVLHSLEMSVKGF